MSSTTCMVDEYSYHLGMLGPAIVIILVLAFMKKRVQLKQDLCNARPALPVPVDFLGKDRNRFITVLAFGATAALCFAMFMDTLFSGSLPSIAAVSKNIPKTPWGKAIRGALMAIVYAIINFPYFACLHNECKLLGYVIGLTYIFLRLIIDLFLYFGSRCRSSKEQIEPLENDNLGYWVYARFLLYLPTVICSVLLVGGYGVLLYKELKKRYRNNGLQFQDILNPETNNDERIAEESDRKHVQLLLANKVYQKRVQQNYEPFYVRLRYKIYDSRPDFKFSTQLLSSLLVSSIFIYQLTVLILLVIVYLKRSFALQYPSIKVELALLFDYVTAAVVIGCFIAILQLGFFLRSHRSDVLRTYRSRKGVLLDECQQPKLLVGKSLRFCGYQIAFTAIGFLFVTLALVFLFLIVCCFHYLHIKMGRKYMLDRAKNVVLSLLPIIIIPTLIWFSLVLMCHFVFRDKTYPDLSININNRRLHSITSYLFFFLNILVGLWSALSRVLKGALLGLVFLCRLDRTSMMTGYRKWDRGFMAYVGFLNVLVAYKHPVMLCFCQMLKDNAHRNYSGSTSANGRPCMSSKSLNRWFLAVMLMRNPSLVRYRRQARMDVGVPPLSSRTALPSVVADCPVPIAVNSVQVY